MWLFHSIDGTCLVTNDDLAIQDIRRKLQIVIHKDVLQAGLLCKTINIEDNFRKKEKYIFFNLSISIYI